MGDRGEEGGVREEEQDGVREEENEEISSTEVPGPKRAVCIDCG